MTIWSGEVRELDKLYEAFKGHLPDIVKELEQLLKTEDANVVMLYSRRCLEVIITDLCENELNRPRKTEPLKGIIDRLNSEEKVPSHIITSMLSLNSMSTYGTHPKDFDPEQVKPVLNNLAIIIRWYLKYKDFQIVSKSKSEEERSKSKYQNVPTEVNRKPNQRLILLLSGLLFGIVIIALVVFYFTGSGTQTKDLKRLEKSIAVLPFKLLSDEPDKQYLADGMMDAITLHLSKIKDLRVMSRTSVEQYRGTTKTTRIIGQELEVEYLLEGSFQKSGENARLIVQLIKTKEESHAWGNEYNSKWKDVFSLQSEVAQKIASELNAVISPEEKEHIEKIPTKNLSAYDAYLKGQFFYEKYTGKEKAIFWLNESIRLDSTFALPWTYLSMLWDSPSTESPRFMNSRQLAERALELDPNSGIALVNMGEILDHEYDFEGAEEKIKLALKMDPNNPYVLRNAGRFYSLFGKADQSISFCKLSLKNDPNNNKALEYLTKAYFYSERYTEAWATLNKYYELEFKGLSELYYKLLIERGNLDKIVTEPSIEQDSTFRNIAQAAVYFRLKNKNTAEKLCNSLNNQIPAYWFAFAYAYGDEPERVYEWLEKSYALKETQFIYLGVEPAFKKFRNDPRFKKLLQKTKFPI